MQHSALTASYCSNEEEKYISLILPFSVVLLFFFYLYSLWNKNPFVSEKQHILIKGHLAKLRDITPKSDSQLQTDLHPSSHERKKNERCKGTSYLHTQLCPATPESSVFLALKPIRRLFIIRQYELLSHSWTETSSSGPLVVGLLLNTENICMLQETGPHWPAFPLCII